MQYNVYRCDLTLHDYLFFASIERGKVAETSPFVHNYALTYALGWASTLWYNAQQKARYRDELYPIDSHYITPARLIHGTSAMIQYNTLSERLRIDKQRSIGYPDWGFIKCFRPGTLFRAYVLSSDSETFPRYIRLGKFMAKTELRVVAARSVTQKQGDCKVPHLLNWNDLSKKPEAFNVQVTSLPTRLISRALFTDIPFLHVTFPDEDKETDLPEDKEIDLPMEMRYLVDIQ
jgi:CRISPR-associated protein Csc1